MASLMYSSRFWRIPRAKLLPKRPMAGKSIMGNEMDKFYFCVYSSVQVIRYWASHMEGRINCSTDFVYINLN